MSGIGVSIASQSPPLHWTTNLVKSSDALVIAVIAVTIDSEFTGQDIGKPRLFVILSQRVTADIKLLFCRFEPLESFFPH